MNVLLIYPGNTNNGLNDIMGDEYEGVELFPAESRMLNTANQYHLWCAPKGVFGMGWHDERLVSSDNPIEKGKQTLEVQ